MYGKPTDMIRLIIGFDLSLIELVGSVGTYYIQYSLEVSCNKYCNHVSKFKIIYYALIHSIKIISFTYIKVSCLSHLGCLIKTTTHINFFLKEKTSTLLPYSCANPYDWNFDPGRRKKCPQPNLIVPWRDDSQTAG